MKKKYPTFERDPAQRAQGVVWPHVAGRVGAVPVVPEGVPSSDRSHLAVRGGQQQSVRAHPPQQDHTPRC